VVPFAKTQSEEDELGRRRLKTFETTGWDMADKAAPISPS
jgi:hypothetical protein